MTREYRIIHEGSLSRAHTTDDDGKKITIPLRGVRGALAWPTKFAPLYFMIMAQEMSSNDEGKCQLHLLHEENGISPAKSFQRLLEVSRKYVVQQVYADLSDKYVELVTLFNDVCRYHQGTVSTLSDAPLSTAFQVGLGLIHEWLPSITVPDGQLKEELSVFSQIHQEDTKTEQQFLAVKALTYILASMELGPWGMPTYTAGGGITRIKGIV